MKNIYFAVVLSLLLFAGCSSTYRVSDFSSKEKFYNDFNNSFKSKEVKVTLINDSTFTASEGAVVKDSTLISYVKVEEKKNMFLARSDLREINFENNEINTATVMLKNGDKLRAENVSIVHDSINFVELKSLLAKNNIAPINKVKTILYKDRWRRIPLGILAGAPLGAFSGIVFRKLLDTRDEKGNPDYFIGVIDMAVVGVLAGCIISYLIGFDEIYQFYP